MESRSGFATLEERNAGAGIGRQRDATQRNQSDLGGDGLGLNRWPSMTKVTQECRLTHSGWISHRKLR